MFMSQMMKQIIFLCKDNKFETFLSPKVLFVHVEYHNKSSKLSHLLAEVNIVINHCSTSKLLCLKCADLFGCNAQQLLFEKRFPTEDKKCCISSYPQSIAALGSFVKLQQRLLRKKKKVLYHTIKIMDDGIFYIDSSCTKQFRTKSTKSKMIYLHIIVWCVKGL